MEKIYLVSKLWTDYYENHPSQAMGYETIGYTASKELAEKIKKQGGTVSEAYKKKYPGPSWMLDVGDPVIKVTEIDVLSENNLPDSLKNLPCSYSKEEL